MRYTAEADPTSATVCHCRDCQKFTGSAFAALIRVAKEAMLRLWHEVPGMRPVHPHIRKNGIAAVPGRTPSYDWSRLTKNRN